jgi:hypothetical protein
VGTTVGTKRGVELRTGSRFEQQGFDARPQIEPAPAHLSRGDHAASPSGEAVCKLRLAVEASTAPHRVVEQRATGCDDLKRCTRGSRGLSAHAR